MRILSEKERIFLTVCVKCYYVKLNVQWKDLYDAGLSKRNIQYTARKLRKEKLINENDYNLNKRKVEYIKELLEYNKKKDKEKHIHWDEFLKTSIIFILIIIVFIVAISYFPFNMFHGWSIDSMGPVGKPPTFAEPVECFNVTKIVGNETIIKEECKYYFTKVMNKSS